MTENELEEVVDLAISSLGEDMTWNQWERALSKAINEKFGPNLDNLTARYYGFMCEKLFKEYTSTRNQ